MLRNLRGSLLLFVVLAICGSNIFAQSSQHIAIHAGHVLDVTTGKMLADQILVIERRKDHQCRRGGQRCQGSLRCDCASSLPNATVLPGLIDAHTHLTMDPEVRLRDAGHFGAARGPDRREECAGHVTCGFHHGAQRGRRRASATWPCAMRSTPEMFRDRACW